MAVITPAIGIQEGSHSAQAFRQLISALVGQDIETFVNSISATGAGHGIVRTGHLAVSQKSGGANMSVDVAKGLALITGSSSLAQGVYAFANDATTNLAIAAADVSNPRRDLVIAQIRDNEEDAGGQNDARLYVVTGTPAGSPSDPTVPPSCLVLARVAVAAGATSITNGNITALAGKAQGSAWNQARGLVARAQTTTPQTGISDTTPTDLTGLSVTFTAVAGRQYKTVLWLPAVICDSAGYLIQAYITDGSNTVIGKTPTAAAGLIGGEKGQVRVEAQEGAIAGSITRKGRMMVGDGSSAGGRLIDTAPEATVPLSIEVYDIGPI